MNQAPSSTLGEEFRRRFTLCVEDRRVQPGYMWNGSDRWFRSPNVVDLWRHRSPDEKTRISNFAWACWYRAKGGVPVWPP